MPAADAMWPQGGTPAKGLAGGFWGLSGLPAWQHDECRASSWQMLDWASGNVSSRARSTKPPFGAPPAASPSVSLLLAAWRRRRCLPVLPPPALHSVCPLPLLSLGDLTPSSCFSCQAVMEALSTACLSFTVLCCLRGCVCSTDVSVPTLCACPLGSGSRCTQVAGQGERSAMFVRNCPLIPR